MSRWTWWRDTERHRTKECPVSGPMLQSYLDGELDAEDAGRVRTHVAECHRCARELSLHQGITDALASRERTDEAALGRLHDFADSLAEREGREPGPEQEAGQSAARKAGG
jgi:anti-sigma factor RsiW